MKLSDAGHQVLCEREGCVLDAYKDSVGVWTIGYGHTSAAGDPYVYQGQKITQEEAEQIFRRDIGEFEKSVNTAIKRHMAHHQFDAYVSLAYNIGGSAFAGSTTVKRFNEGKHKEAAEAILMWNKPPEVMNRRRGEYEQFKGTQTVARIDASGKAV